MDFQVGPQVHGGPAVGDRDLHPGACLPVVDQSLDAPWPRAIGHREFVP